VEIDMKNLLGKAISLVIIGFLMGPMAFAAEVPASGSDAFAISETFTLFQYPGASPYLFVLNGPINLPNLDEDADSPTTSEAACPTGCYFMRCPPPSGPYVCCKIPGYYPC